MKRPSWVRTLAALAFSITLTLVLAELLLRLTEVGRPWMRLFHENDALVFQRPAAIFDPHGGARFKPGWRGRYHYAGGRESVAVEVNQLGFRFPADRDQPAAGITRVALFGDSVVAGLQVEESSHVRALLEGALNAERPAEVLNFGIPGTGPVNQLGIYRSFAARLRPAVVVLGIYTDNDFTDNENTPWRNADGTLIDEPFASAPGDIGKTLKANFCLMMAISTLREVAAHRRDAEAAAAAAADTDAALLGRRETYELAHVSPEAFRKALDVWDEFVTEIRGASAVPIVLLFPDNSVFTDGHWDYARPTTRLLHERLARHFEGEGVQVIRGAVMLHRHSERYGAQAWAKYKNYLSEEGHETLAELLAARIREVLPPWAATVPGAP
jgi:hypothetical protein